MPLSRPTLSRMMLMTLIPLSAVAVEAAEPAQSPSHPPSSGIAPAAVAEPPAPAPGALPTSSAKSASAPSAAKQKSDNPGSQWVFSLLPKSLQKNPRVEMTVITEMTDAGKKLPEATPQAPAYFLAQSAGFHSLGDGSRRDHAPLPEALEDMLKKALAANGYLPSHPPAHPPSLLVIYSWGAHYALHPEDDPAISAAMVERNILDRAGLVGGPQFAQRLERLFAEKSAIAEANPPPRPDLSGSGSNPGIDPILGEAEQAFIDPIRRFAAESPKNSFIIDQAFDDVYFVVASAYDYAAAGQNERRLLWRTRMTVDSRGVAMDDTLPTLIDTAAPYFGREMTEPETLHKRALKEGNVEVGTPRVVPDDKAH